MKAATISIIIFSFIFVRTVQATTIENIPAGSYVINMGVTPQTVANALKPYGLVFDLVRNYQVPIKWVIEPTKLRNGNDFSYNGNDYRGGPFIIRSEFITPAIDTIIQNWMALGVLGNYISTPINVPVYFTITAFPTLMIDTTSGLQQIIINYFNNAGIPTAAYSTGAPSGLTSCYDMWANPHGDPTWQSHSYLYDYVTIEKCWIWAQCHAVSAMESAYNPVNVSQGLNFLSSSGLKCWGVNKCGASNTEFHAKNPAGPYSYYYPTDPMMQFMFNMHNACIGGSEQWFIPKSTGQWNSPTRRGVTTGTGVAPQEGTMLVYGPAFGDSTNGWVMYEGGHAFDSGGTSATDRVAAQRAFFNYQLLSMGTKGIQFTPSGPPFLVSGYSDIVNATVTSGASPFTFQWTSTLGGTFLSDTSASTIYTAPSVTDDTTDVLRITVTDSCGRASFQYVLIHIFPLIELPVSLISFDGEQKESSVELRWTTASEINNSYFTLSRSSNPALFEPIGTVNGNGTTTISHNYTFVDEHPLDGNNYYRLTQTDADGRSESFPPILVKVKAKEAPVVFYPNPFDENLNFIFTGNASSANVRIINTIGQNVYYQNFTLSNSENVIQLDTKDLNTGTYFVNIITGEGETFVHRVVKK
jgi:hypothetical protein